MLFQTGSIFSFFHSCFLISSVSFSFLPLFLVLILSLVSLLHSYFSPLLLSSLFHILLLNCISPHSVLSSLCFALAQPFLIGPVCMEQACSMTISRSIGRKAMKSKIRFKRSAPDRMKKGVGDQLTEHVCLNESLKKCSTSLFQRRKWMWLCV